MTIRNYNTIVHVNTHKIYATCMNSLQDFIPIYRHLAKLLFDIIIVDLESTVNTLSVIKARFEFNYLHAFFKFV